MGRMVQDTIEHEELEIKGPVNNESEDEYKRKIESGRKKVENGRKEWLDIRWNIRNKYG